MFGGLTVALVTGVPLGTFVGQHFGWRTTFLVVAALGVVSIVASLLFVPRKLAHTKPASLIQQMGVVRQPRLLLVYAMTAVGYGGTFIAFTYLAPMLEQITGFDAGVVHAELWHHALNLFPRPPEGTTTTRVCTHAACGSALRSARRSFFGAGGGVVVACPGA